MNGLSIRTKITIWFMVVLIVVMGINFAVFFFIGERVTRDVSKADLSEMVKSNISEVRHVEGEPDEDIKQSIRYLGAFGDGYVEVDDFRDLVSGVACGVYTSEGKLLYGLDLLPNETRELEFIKNEIRTVDAGKETFYVLDEPVSAGIHGDIWIRGMINRAQDRDQVYRMYRTYLMFIPLMILLSAVIAYLAARRALLPIDRIAEDISTINRETDLSHRVESDSEDYEIKTIVNALNHMFERLEKSHQATKKFTANVSHDLRTPVAIIMANTELALEEDLPEDVRESFENIQKQGARMSDILNALLSFYRLENINETFKKSELNISDVVRSTCSSFMTIKNEERVLEEDIRDDLFINGNETLIRGLVENLLSNAFKYSDDDGKVSISLKEEGDVIRLAVSDNGVGIEKEEQERIFQWMYRVDEGYPEGGSGLGLYIVGTTVQYHDAELKLDSKPGEGSTFTVDFPRKIRGQENEHKG